MPISHQINCIFIHIPKTAGTSIEVAMGMHGNNEDLGLVSTPLDANTNTLFGKGLQHLTAVQIKNYFKNFGEYFKFTFVRNPWDRFASATLYDGPETKNKNQISKNDFYDLGVKRFYNSKETLEKCLTIKYGIKHSHYTPQLEYILENGEPIVDYIGKYENLRSDFDIICKKLKFKCTLEHRNSVKRKHYTDYYNNEAKQFVAEKYAKDIEYFGYKFGE
tara:strand:- start:597 stop:1253 length:657 start_codon:yes stop_codon:yes gene_type:complete